MNEDCASVDAPKAVFENNCAKFGALGIQSGRLGDALLFANCLSLLERINTRLLALGRAVSVVAIGLMVFVILLQVFFRYVLNNALPWPDEAARFCMLWMAGLMAPSAYRWGSFVSIDMVKDRIGGRAGGILNLVILLLGLAVFFVAMQFAMKHIASGWLFNSSSLKLPLHLIGYEVVRIKLAWMYMSLPVGFSLMILVNVELTLKQIHMLLDPGIRYEPAPDRIEFSAE